MVNSRSGKFSKNTVLALQPPTVLLSKIGAPRIPENLMPRQILQNPFKLSKIPRLVVMEASPGYAKTCTTAFWLQECGISNCWLSLDSTDNDTGLFWQYLIKACIRVLPGMTDLTVPDHINEHFLTRLVNAMTLACEQQPGVRVALVIDNFHHINNPDIQRAFGFVLNHLPADITLLILSRRPLQLARRARQLADGELAQYDARQLSFTDDESASFLDSHYSGDRSGEAWLEDDIIRGWPMGLRLLSLASASDMNGTTINAELVHDYMIEEAFLSQPAIVRDILASVCPLACLAPDVVDGLVPSQDGFNCIELLQIHGLYLETDAHTGHYRLHRVFRKAICEHLAKTDSDNFRIHCAAAAAELERKSYLPEAIALWAQLNEWEKAVSLIFSASAQYIAAKDFQSLHSWLSLLPQRWINRCPKALYLSALTESHTQEWDPKALQSRLVQAEEILCKAIDAHRDTRVQVLSQLSFSSEEQARKLLQDIRKLRTELIKRGSQHTLIEPLSGREIEILNLIAAGLRNKDIADRLSIALSTVKAHIYNIFSKLQSKSRTEAVSLGREMGII
ncbi:MAG: LuxR C-terminal-related transcriptional regulator [Halioglobus sp.]